MQVYLQFHASVFRHPYRQNQDHFQLSKTTISQKIKSEKIPFLSKKSRFYRLKVHKEKKSKENLSLTSFEKRDACENSFPREKIRTKEKKRKAGKQLHSGLYFTIFANFE